MHCKRKITSKFQDIFTNDTEIESRSNQYFSSIPHPRVVLKVLPSSPISLSSPISKLEISVYPTEKDPVSQESQCSSEDWKHVTQILAPQEYESYSLLNYNTHVKVCNIKKSNNSNS